MIRTTAFLYFALCFSAYAQQDSVSGSGPGAAPPVPNPLPPEWSLVQPDPYFDCNYNDGTGPTQGPTEGTDRPDVGRCPLNLSYIAICWDGVKYKNASNTKKDPTLAWCTYKTLTPTQCRALGRAGPGTPGRVYVCESPKVAPR